MYWNDQVAHGSATNSHDVLCKTFVTMPTAEQSIDAPVEFLLQWARASYHLGRMIRHRQNGRHRQVGCKTNPCHCLRNLHRPRERWQVANKNKLRLSVDGCRAQVAMQTVMMTAPHPTQPAQMQRMAWSMEACTNHVGAGSCAC